VTAPASSPGLAERKFRAEPLESGLDEHQELYRAAHFGSVGKKLIGPRGF
jgi:hypothetical protein